MIWFACKQCGKVQGRSEGEAGTLVFCECGQGNRVPWESTAPEPDPAETPAPLPAAPAPRARRWEPPADDEAGQPLPPPRRRAWEGRRPNPAYCLNHDETASEQTCDDCRCAFCAACLVRLQGRTLCGPCKNFRVRALNRPSRSSPLAIVALVVALVTSPVAFVITLMAIGLQVQGGPVPGVALLCLAGLALPAGALVLACVALRRVETRPGVGGRSLAAGGAVAALAGSLWALTAGVVLVTKQW
jgi:hypothetical protein